MPGKYQYDIELKSNVAKLLTDMKEVQDRLDTVEGKEYKIKLNVDEKKLSNVISNLEKMLGYLGKGTGDFKQFENLSKQLSSITTDINNISKAFSVMNDGSDFANSIKSIDTSLTALSNHFVSEMSGRMTSSIKEVKSTLSDIGDGGELAPLLQTINKIENAINELSTSVKGIGLNMNIDVGSDSEMEAKVQSKIVNALQAYQRLFDHIKMSSAGGQIITDKFFDFDINQYDTMMGKLQAYKNFIDNMRKEAKAQFNGQDVLYQDTEKGYWTKASAAMGQVTKAFNEMKSASDTNPLKDLFGSGDLSEVVSQLGLIVAKLEEISTTASSFKNVFANGFNITASVEEIDKLTNRVKELEDELAKIKLNLVNVDKSNISSEKGKDVFQGDDKATTDASATAIKEESQVLEQVSTSAKDAATSKEKFANANKEVKASAESSSTSLNEEKKKIDNVGNSAEETKKKLDDVVFKPNTEGFDEIVSKLDIAKDKIEEISKITKSSVWSESQGEYLESYNIKYKNGTSEIRGESSNKKGSNVLRANEVAYDVKAAEQEAKERLKSEQKVQAQKDAFHKKNLTAIDLEIQKREEEAKSFSSSLKAQMEERQKDISSMESSLKSFNESSKQLSAKPDGQHQFSSWKKQLEDLNIKIAEYKNKVENLSKIDIADEEQIKKAKTEIEELGNRIKETITSMKNIPQASRGWNQSQVDKLIQRMNDDLKKNSNYTKETRRNIEGLIEELKNIPDRPLSEVFNDFSRFKREAHDARKEGKAFFEIFKEKVIYGGAAQLAGMVGFYDVINVGREIVTNIKEVDTALTELRKVSDATEQRLTTNFKNSADTAKELGATISDVISATADWSRMGYNIDQAEELARVSTLYKNVGDGIDIETANNSLISTLQGFQLDASEAESIIDKFNEVANNYAIDSAGIGEALQRSAASFNAANTDLSKSIALITATRLKKLVEYMETYIKNIFNCHRSLYYYAPQYRGNYYMMA